MPQLLLLIGLPGSGKSSLAGQLAIQVSGSRIISTDTIRAELFGEEAIQGPWLLVWRQVDYQFRCAVEQIKDGKSSRAIYDATNTARRKRRDVLTLARAAGFTNITGVWVDTPLSVCLERNRRRDRSVPEAVIERMYRQLRDAPPSPAEGIDRLLRYSSTSEYGNCDVLSQ